MKRRLKEERGRVFTNRPRLAAHSLLYYWHWDDWDWDWALGEWNWVQVDLGRVQELV